MPSHCLLSLSSMPSSNATDHYGCCHPDCHSRLATLYCSYSAYFWLLSTVMWFQNLPLLLVSGDLLQRSSFHCQVQHTEHSNYRTIQKYQTLSCKHILYWLSEGISFFPSRENNHVINYLVLHDKSILIFSPPLDFYIFCQADMASLPNFL